MRIKVGNKVEAWITDEATNMGAWRAGEVTWGNGHAYNIKWLDGGPESRRILRKFVRPSPKPDVQLPKDVAPGDIVELLDGNLWRWVEVVRVGDRQFDVKFIGNTNILTVDVRALRPRLMFGEEGWALIHKNGQIPIESPVPSRPIAGKNLKRKATGNGNGNGGSNFAAHAAKLGETKRSDCTVDIVRDVKRFQGNGGTNSNRLFAKREEPAARYNDNIQVMNVHLKKRQETGNNVDCFLARRTDKDKDDNDVSSKSDTSSTGDSSSSSSSSGSNIKAGDRAVSATLEHCQENEEAQIQLLPSFKQKGQDSDDTTESHASARMQHHHRANEVQVVMNKDEQEEQHGHRVHSLELEAYVSVMKAFHATGSLTWTKEELLSNLRMHLHVSSDEHLQIIRGLNGKKEPAGGPRNGPS